MNGIIKPKINYKILNKTNNFALLKIKNETNSSSGLALTLSNTLRRVLLNNIAGTAITSITINNIKSTTMFSDNFKEDLLEIFSNVKELALRSTNLGCENAYLKIQGPAIVTAADIALPKNLIVVDPKQYLFTIVTDAEIDIEFGIEQGFGYKLYNENYEIVRDNKYLIDANFTPIKKVNYKIILEDSELNPGTLVETIFLEIWTNGSISPLRAFLEACKTTSLLFSSFLI